MNCINYNTEKKDCQEGKRGGLPSGLVSIKNNVHANGVCIDKSRVSRFRKYKDKLENEVIILQNRENEKQLMLILPLWHSRYFEEGRRYIRRKIYERMGKFANMRGVFLTLTYDPSLIKKGKAWASYGRHVRKVLNTINEYRRRRGWKRVNYFWVVEVQKGTGYPHIHIFFPGLKWLAKKEYILGAWGKGRTRVEMAKSINGFSYIAKYIGKLRGWGEEFLAFIWEFRGRLYSFSRFFYVIREYKEKHWKRFKFMHNIGEINFYGLFKEGYEISGFG